MLPIIAAARKLVHVVLTRSASVLLSYSTMLPRRWSNKCASATSVFLPGVPGLSFVTFDCVDEGLAWTRTQQFLEEAN